MNWKLALTALLASPGPSLFASARKVCPPKPEPIRHINFSDIGGEGIHGYELHGDARIVEPAPEGIPRALRIDSRYSYALIKGIDIGPANLPEVTLSVSAYIESIRPCPGCNEAAQVNSYGWVISHDNGGWDRAIFLHDERFKGMGLTNGQFPKSKFELTPTLQKWIHIIGVWRQGGECSLFIENQRIPFTQAVIGRNNEGLPDVAIGAPQQRRFGKGNDNDLWVKDVKIFDYALDDEEIDSLDCHFEDELDPTIDCGNGGDLVYSCTDCVSGDGSATGCMGDCMWDPFNGACTIDDDNDISCGDHDAADCSQCDAEADGSGCAGECKFAAGECRPDNWVPPVDCGDHEAATCGECPYGEGASGCAGQCMWDPMLGECTDDNGDDISCGDHDAADCSQCDTEADGSGCSGECKFAAGECRPDNWVPPVDCGTHEAATCGECPNGEGASGCAGQCMWDPMLGECTDDNGDDISCGDHDAADCSQCDTEADGSGCSGECKFVDGACRPDDYDSCPATCLAPKAWKEGAYGYTHGNWRIEKNPRFVVDVNGDGKADIVAFANHGVEVSLAECNKFGPVQKWIDNKFNYNAGWRVEKHPRVMADVNGDGMADVIGFGNGGTYVSLSTGTGFTAPKLWLAKYGYNVGGVGGWRVEKNLRFVVDVNGDGKADVVGFGNGSVSVALSTGTGFAQPKVWLNAFVYGVGDWRVEKHPRFLEDVNGDGLPDIVGFSNNGVDVSLNTGSSFAWPKQWIKTKFSYGDSWSIEKHPRFVADVNGDGKADIVGFGTRGTFVSLSTGSSFTQATSWITNYHYNAGWRVENHPRFVVDVNGDGKADVVGFYNTGTYVSLSTGTSFAKAELKFPKFGWNSNGEGGWRVEKHPRFLADVTGDGLPDVVGFGYYSVGVGNFCYTPGPVAPTPVPVTPKPTPVPVPPKPTPISCGYGKTAGSCAQCVKGGSPVGCSGQCAWSNSSKKCVPKPPGGIYQCGDHQASSCAQCGLSPNIKLTGMYYTNTYQPDKHEILNVSGPIGTVKRYDLKKMRGDRHVPKGQVSIRVWTNASASIKSRIRNHTIKNVTWRNKYCSKAHPKHPAEVQVAAVGFVQRSWVPGYVILFSQTQFMFISTDNKYQMPFTRATEAQKRQWIR